MGIVECVSWVFDGRAMVQRWAVDARDEIETSCPDYDVEI